MMIEDYLQDSCRSFSSRGVRHGAHRGEGEDLRDCPAGHQPVLCLQRGKAGEPGRST